MYRHSKKQDETSELTISEFRRILLISLGKLNSKDTSRQGTDELASLAQRLNPEDESLSIFVVIRVCISLTFRTQY